MSNNVTSWAAVSDSAAENYSIPTRPDTSLSGTSTRVYDGPIRMVGGEEVTSQGTSRVGEADLVPVSAGMLATVRNNGGFPTARVTPDCTVDLPGFGRTSVKVAEHLGYLHLTPDGRYIETQPGGQKGAQQQAQEGDQQQAQEDGPELFSQGDERRYSEMIADIPQPIYDSVMGQAAALIGAAQTGEAMVSKLAPRLAAATGIEPARAASVIAEGRAVWQFQADSALADAGVVPDEFYQWAMTNRKSDLQAAVIKHINGRSTKGYSAMVADYLEHTAPSVEHLAAQGIPTKQEGKTTMIKLKGSWMSLHSAVKAKLL